MSIAAYNYVTPVIELLDSLDRYNKAPAGVKIKAWADWCRELRSCGYPDIADVLVTHRLVPGALIVGRGDCEQAARIPEAGTLEAIQETLGLVIDISHCYFHAEPEIQQYIRPALAISKALKRRPPETVSETDVNR